MKLNFLCIYHANCTDGFTAAWAVNENLRTHHTGANKAAKIEYVPASHGEAPPNVSGKHVIIVDFCYKRSVIEQMARDAASLTILDHHKSAALDLKGLGYKLDPLSKWGAWVDMITGSTFPNNIFTLFDMKRSGASIAWDFFHAEPETKRPRLVDYVENQDLWIWDLPDGREIAEYINTIGRPSFRLWNDLATLLASDDGYKQCARLGRTMILAKQRIINDILGDGVRFVEIHDLIMPIVNAPHALASDIGDFLARKSDTGASISYYDTPKGRVFSLRSIGKTDVSVIAVKSGGGGHPNAAGFTAPTDFQIPYLDDDDPRLVRFMSNGFVNGTKTLVRQADK